MVLKFRFKLRLVLSFLSIEDEANIPRTFPEQILNQPLNTLIKRGRVLTYIGGKWYVAKIRNPSPQLEKATFEKGERRILGHHKLNLKQVRND